MQIELKILISYVHNGQTKKNSNIDLKKIVHIDNLPGWTNQLLPKIATHLDTTLRNNEN